MHTIAQILLDKYNSVTEVVQSAISNAADKGINAIQQGTAPKALTEEQARAKEMMRKAFHKGVWVVHFTKVDGTQTTMEATLDEQLMPATTIFAGAEKKKPVPEHLLAVYSPDRQGWRSFVVSNVSKIEPKK